ncbi:MAG TPA: copper resistance protein CopC [Actinomycetota bacterium]|nr:copper resistance protein CopC [Actinomycetota bacterium]
MKRTTVAAAALAAVLMQAAPALAHAERSASTPEEGATVAVPPGVLNVTFTEPPTGDAVVEVADGCGRDVVADLEIQNFEIAATLAEGQPGRWTVRTNVISAVDGHNTRDRWTFAVRGEPDCSAAESAPPDDTAAGGDDDEGGGSSALPLLAVGGATVALVVLGLMLRGRGT